MIKKRKGNITKQLKCEHCGNSLAHFNKGKLMIKSKTPYFGLIKDKGIQIKCDKCGKLTILPIMFYISTEQTTTNPTD